MSGHKHRDHVLDGHIKALARAMQQKLDIVKCALTVHIEMVNLRSWARRYPTADM